MIDQDKGNRGEKKEISTLTSYGIYGAAGAQLAMSTVGFLLAGHYLDGRWGTDPWLAVAGLVLGFVGGLVNLLRIVRRFCP
jgi:hypothetical protein